MIQRTFAAAKKAATLEMLVYDVIGSNWDGSGITVKNFAKQLKDAGEFDSITLRINSPGGDAFEGVAILNLLRAQEKPVNVFVDGIAASAASIIAMAGDVTMGDGSMLMIHNAWSFAMGDGAALRKTADTLDKVSASIADTYANKTGMPVATVQSLMDAETWLSAEDAVAQGFAKEIVELPASDAKKAKALAHSYNVSERFSNAPVLEAPADDVPAPEPVAAAAPELPSNLSLYQARLRVIGR